MAIKGQNVQVRLSIKSCCACKVLTISFHLVLSSLNGKVVAPCRFWRFVLINQCFNLQVFSLQWVVEMAFHAIKQIFMRCRYPLLDLRILNSFQIIIFWWLCKLLNFVHLSSKLALETSAVFSKY